MRIRMIGADGGRHVAAGDPADLLAELIPGYRALPPQQRRTARVNHAERSLARIRQRLMVAFAARPAPMVAGEILLVSHGPAPRGMSPDLAESGGGATPVPPAG